MKNNTTIRLKSKRRINFGKLTKPSLNANIVLNFIDFYITSKCFLGETKLRTLQYMKQHIQHCLSNEEGRNDHLIPLNTTLQLLTQSRNFQNKARSISMRLLEVHFDWLFANTRKEKEEKWKINGYL